jgi:hypothetical protein
MRGKMLAVQLQQKINAPANGLEMRMERKRGRKQRFSPLSLEMYHHKAEGCALLEFVWWVYCPSNMGWTHRVVLDRNDHGFLGNDCRVRHDVCNILLSVTLHELAPVFGLSSHIRLMG